MRLGKPPLKGLNLKGDRAMIDTPAAVPMHIAITATDLDRSVRFYVEAFGFSVGFEREAEEDFSPIMQLENTRYRETFLVLEGMMLMVCQFDRPEVLPRNDEPFNRAGINKISFGVANLENAAKRVEEAGGKVLAQTRYENPLATMMNATDPDGNILGLIQTHDTRKKWN